MTYAIVFSSITGNTAALADYLHSMLPADSCVYFGDVSREAAKLDADLFFVGFRTEDDGTCDSKSRVFLKALNDKTVVLFGTSGYEMDKNELDRVMSAAAKHVPVSSTVITGVICPCLPTLQISDEFDQWAQSFKK